jgi:hypothetical protein
MDDEMPTTRPPAPTAEPMTSDADLSRIAREAVRQPADPRMDRQLARMGLTDGGEPDARRTTQAAQAAASAQQIAQLEGQVRRLRVLVVVLAVAVVALAVAVVARTAS